MAIKHTAAKIFNIANRILIPYNRDNSIKLLLSLEGSKPELNAKITASSTDSPL
jgi:hypothetical protein